MIKKLVVFLQFAPGLGWTLQENLKVERHGGLNRNTGGSSPAELDPTSWLYFCLNVSLPEESGIFTLPLNKENLSPSFVTLGLM